MFALDAREKRLARGALGEEQHGCLREGPLQVRVADLGASGAAHLPGRALLALHQPAVGREVLDALEAADVVDFVEDRQGEDLVDPWDAPYELEGVRGMVPSLADYREFERADDQLEVVDERGIGGDAVSDSGDRVEQATERDPPTSLFDLAVGSLDLEVECGDLAEERTQAGLQLRRT